MTSHWPIIAAIIAIVNQWTIFWFKVYWDKRASATAKPTTNQPKTVTEAKRRWARWFIAFAQFLAGWVCLIAIEMLWTIKPATAKSVALIGLCALSFICVNLLPWAVRKSIPAPQYRTLYGLFWDAEHIPHCPSDRTPLSHFLRTPRMGQLLYCPTCRSTFPLRDDNGAHVTLAEIKTYLAGQNLPKISN